MNSSPELPFQGGGLACLVEKEPFALGVRQCGAPESLLQVQRLRGLILKHGYDFSVLTKLSNLPESVVLGVVEELREKNANPRDHESETTGGAGDKAKTSSRTSDLSFNECTLPESDSRPWTALVEFQNHNI